MLFSQICYSHHATLVTHVDTVRIAKNNNIRRSVRMRTSSFVKLKRVVKIKMKRTKDSERKEVETIT